MMQNIIKKLIFLQFILSIFIFVLHATTEDELMELNKVTTAVMNNIDTPKAGSLVYNLDEKTTFFYTGIVWKKMRSDGDETIINAGNNIIVTGNGTNTSVYVIGM